GGEDAFRQRGPLAGPIADVCDPHLTADRRDVGGIGDFFVPKEFGPRAVRCIGEVVDRALSRGVPAALRLATVFPQEWIACVHLPEDDHVAESAISSRASSRTRIGPSSSGSQLPFSTAAGARPSSSVRLRWNQRRTPMSLYDPDKSPTTRARKCSRAATSSGVSRSPDWYRFRLDTDTLINVDKSSALNTRPRLLHSNFGTGDA